jgi:transposase
VAFGQSGGEGQQGSRGVGKKRGPEEPSDRGLGRSQGGFSSKIHLVCDDEGNPSAAVVTAGQVHESQYVAGLVHEAAKNMTDERGELEAWALQMCGDKAYRADWIDDLLEEYDIQAVIPSKKNETNAQERFFDRKAYRRRNVIERLVATLKEMRRIATRYDKLNLMYDNMICLGLASYILDRYPNVGYQTERVLCLNLNDGPLQRRKRR